MRELVRTLRAMSQITFLRNLALSAAAVLAAAQGSAQGLRPTGYFVQGGLAGGGDWSATAGLVWPWAWKSSLWGTQLSASAEASISHWDAKGSTHRNGFTHVALVPLLRVRFDGGRSAWFAEGGIGVSLMDQQFVTQTKQFTTAFNFVDTLGVGISLGPSREQELGLRLQHVSNAGIRVPNPGQNFLQLRYGSTF